MEVAGVGWGWRVCRIFNYFLRRYFLLTVQEIFFSVGERRCPDRGVVSSGEKKRRLAFSPYHTLTQISVATSSGCACRGTKGMASD